MSRAEEREAIRDLIARSGRLLDTEAFEDFVALFAPDGLYEMKAYSPEIGRDMTWLSADRDELAGLLEELAEHVRDPSTRAHIISVDRIDLDGDDARARATFVVFRTDPRGETTLYAVGRYDDDLVRHNGAWRLRRRTVTPQTRLFSTPTPTPL